MEKKKDCSKQIRGSSSSQSYGLLRSIIKFSSSSTLRHSSSSSPQNPVLVKNPSEVAENGRSRPVKHTTTKHGNQSPSSCSSSSTSTSRERPSGSDGGGGGGSTLVGAGPRTFSILTALSELEVSNAEEEELGNVIPRPRSMSPPSVSKVNNSKVYPHHTTSSISGWRNSGLASSSRTSSSDTFHNTFSHTSARRKKPGRRPLLEKAILTQTVSHGGESTKLSSCSNSVGRISKSCLDAEKTPEWIWKIFQLAKRGQLSDLQTSLEGLDASLIRHLVDVSGNTLLHVAARAGHINIIQYLIGVLGPFGEEALKEQNQAGRNVLLSALKGGRSECFQWMVLHTNSRTALIPRNGERSLLHFAASYGNEVAVRWLSQLIRHNGLNVDIKDAYGLTPLHVAAKLGFVHICHELILAGAQVATQTELGHRPVDLAVRHRRIECVNYLMMAETASSVGSSFDGCLKEFQSLQDQHEALRSLFRELLRIGKWLVKERTDLIKNFSSTGSGNSAVGDASTLLGGSGTRLSELEHKLEQIEHEWKQLPRENKTWKEFKGHLGSDESSSYHFLNGLADVQSRCHDSLHQNRPSSSSSSAGDDESCSNSDDSKSHIEERSGDRLDHSSSFSAYSEMKSKPSSFMSRERTPSSFDHHQHPHNNRRKQEVSSTPVPWLPGNDILAQLSPFVSFLPQLSGAPAAPLQSSQNFDAQQNSIVGKSIPTQGTYQNSICHDATPLPSTERSGSKGSETNTVVLEVIEPTSTPAKEGCLTPDLIRKTTRGKATLGGDSTKTLSGEWERDGRQSEVPSTVTITSVPYLSPKPRTSSSVKSLKSLDEVKVCSPPSCPKRTLQSKTCQTKSGQSHKALHVDYHTHIPSLPQNISSQQEEMKKSSEERESSDALFNESIILSTEVTPPPGTSNLTVLPVITSSSPVTFPILTSIEFTTPWTEEETLISSSSCEVSSHMNLPLDSVSSSNTPVMARSFSSASRQSGAVVFPAGRKGSWLSSDFPSLNATEFNLLERLSPSPSENSRTESALHLLAPSSASHASTHNSEVSKTESAREVITTVVEGSTIDESSRRYNSANERKEMYFEQRDIEEEEAVVYLKNRTEKKKRKSGTMDDDESTEIVSPGSMMMPSSNIHSTGDAAGESTSSRCTIRQPLVSSRGIHKATIQRVTKSTGGGNTSKPWYEFEVSDDEDSRSILRRQTRSSKSSTSKSLVSPELSQSETENSSEKSNDDDNEDDSKTEFVVTSKNHRRPEFV